MLNKKPKLKFKFRKIGVSIQLGEKKDYLTMNHEEYAALNLSGIVAGLVPILLMYSYNGNLMYFAMILPYAWGAMPDFVNMLEALKKVN